MKMSINEANDNAAGSIIMGKSPSDVDLIGLSRSILMKSNEKQIKQKTRREDKSRNDEMQNADTSSTTPYNQEKNSSDTNIHKIVTKNDNSNSVTK